MAEPSQEQTEQKDLDSENVVQTFSDSKLYVTVKDKYRIYPGRPMSVLDTPSAKAYYAADMAVPEHKIFALVCKPNLPIRSNNLNVMRSIKSEGLMTLADAGTVHWPAFDSKTMILLYEQPLGGRVMTKSTTSRVIPTEEAELIARWARPLLMGINDLSVRGVTHRAIRPDNLFYMDAEKEHVVWGDCISCPSAYDQPYMFETIESAMCMPEGRGAGTTANDLYSFGATLVCLSLGRDPVAKLSEQELMDLKIKKGSYAALVGEERISLSLIELLRGLLSDNPEQRWNISSAEMWMDGRRMTPIQTRGNRNSQRPFLFNGIEYFSYRDLAVAFTRNWDMAADAIRSEKLATWVKRGFEDTVMADEISKSISIANMNFSIRERQDDFLVSRICMVLDNRAPLRMRHLNFMPEALGTVLGMTMIQQKDLKPLIGIITMGFLESWYEFQHDKVARQSVKNLQMILQKPELGMGIERCLYELNDGLPCQSPMIVKEYIDDVRKLLPALESVSKKADPRSWPLDRHISAYIAAKFGAKVSEQLTAINRPKASTATGGMLSLLAMLQWTFGPEKLFALSSWIGGLISPIIKSYHDHEKQQRMEKELPKYIRKGNLAELYRFLDNKEDRVLDEQKFEEAKREYTEISGEIDYLDGSRVEREEYGIMLGNQIASVLSFTIAVLTMLLLLLERFIRG